MDSEEVPIDNQCHTRGCYERSTKICAGCHCNRYCSVTCQQKDWSQHKPWCRTVQKQFHEHPEMRDKKIERMVTLPRESYNNLINDLKAGKAAHIVDKYNQTEEVVLYQGVLYEKETKKKIVIMEDICQQNDEHGQIISESNYSRLMRLCGPPIEFGATNSVFRDPSGKMYLYWPKGDRVDEI